MDDRFGPVIARCCLGAEDEGDRRQIPELAAFQLVVDREDAQGVHELAFVFMQALYLHVKDHVRIQGDTLPAADLGGQLLLLCFLHGTELVAKGGVDLRDQLFQQVQVRLKARTDLIGDQPAEFGIAQTQPAALGDAVGLVLEAFRPDGIPVGKKIVLQDFTVQGGNAIGGVGRVDGQLRHMYPSVQDDAQGRSDLFPELLHLFPETGVDLPDDGNDLRAVGGEQAQVPLLQGFLHDGMVGIGKGVPCDQESLFKGNPVLAQQADQFRDCHCGMGIIQLGGYFLRKEGIVAAMAFPVSPQDILHGRGDQNILLADAQLFAFPTGVVGIEELGDILGLVLVCGSLRVVLGIEEGKVDLMEAFSLPETERADILRAEADDRHIIGNSEHIAGLHGNDDGFIRAADRPWIAEL